MAKVWMVVVEGEKHGPLSNSELKSLADVKRLKPTDLVWKEGMAEWVPARKIKGLFPAVTLPLPCPRAPAAADKSPDVVSAAKELFGAVAGAVKRAGSRIREAAEKAAEQPSAATEEQQSAIPAPPKLSRRTLIAATVGGGVLLLSCAMCGVIGAIFDRQRETPEAAYIASQKAIGEEGDFGAFFDRTTNEYQKNQILGAEIMKKTDPTKSHLKNLSGRELWIAIMKDATKGENKKYKKTLDPIEVVSTEISGNGATVRIRRGNGDVYTINMVKQDGSWRIIIPDL